MLDDQFTMINLGLSRISKLLSSTTIPWKAVHIAGTNGKGSVANIISSLLYSSGFSVGRFTSPHLINRWDCITINQKVVDKPAFIGVEKILKARNEADNINASEFELLTATAFEIFSRAQVDIGVIECGMGGRLDATNVLKQEQVLCSVFAKIGMDHEGFLGDNIVAIAKEKAGIMKTGVPFVIDQSNPAEVLLALDKHAKEVGAKQGTAVLPADMSEQITTSPADMVRNQEFDPARRTTGEVHERGIGAAVDTSQWPLHQQQNLKTALLAWHTLQSDDTVSRKLERPFKASATGILGLDQIAAIRASQFDWPGRLQIIDTSSITGDGKLMLLDGAHNRQAANALAGYVQTTYRSHGPVVWVIAMSKGKNAKELFSALLRHQDQVVITQFGPVDGMPWVQSDEPSEVAQAIRGMTRSDVHVEPEPWYALRRASQIAAGKSQVIICGSLYLVGDVLRMLSHEQPKAVEGPKWDEWVNSQREKLELRRYENHVQTHEAGSKVSDTGHLCETKIS